MGDFVQYADDGIVEVHVYLTDADIDRLRDGTSIEAAPQPNEQGNVVLVRVAQDRRSESRPP
jgi:hypothetical protein